jgi:hypothetical protein
MTNTLWTFLESMPATAAAAMVSTKLPPGSGGTLPGDRVRAYREAIADAFDRRQ